MPTPERSTQSSTPNAPTRAPAPAARRGLSRVARVLFPVSERRNPGQAPVDQVQGPFIQQAAATADLYNTPAGGEPR